MSPVEATNNINYRFVERKVILRIRNRVCESAEELVHSALFEIMVIKSIEYLKERRSILLTMFGKEPDAKISTQTLIQTLQYLIKLNLEETCKILPQAECFLGNEEQLFNYTEFLYNYWRSFDRIIICDSVGDRLDKRPYRTFNYRVESLGDLIRKVYRDIQENLMKHPNIYRQIHAGANMGTIALPKKLNLPETYPKILEKIGVIRQILINPPLVLETPMNKRKGQFERVDENPLLKMSIYPDEWLCFPVKVGSLVILTYIHETFYSLGLSMANLFQIATDEELEKKPDGLYFYGVEEDLYSEDCECKTCFFDDEEEDLLIAAIPRSDEFGYFGYLKKMILTLHNIIKMKNGNLPFHGSFTKIYLREGEAASILLVGDTGAGKSETLEAFQSQGTDLISNITIIADDMGSLKYGESGEVLGYGTEVGAFLRLDDLSPASTFGTIDRAIFMNATKTNARVIIPVTELHDVLRGTPVDMLLYANNYEAVDEEHPIIERFESPEDALNVFRQGKAMSKGTTAAKGLQSTYFVNIFGPPAYYELHEELAKQYFTALFDQGAFIGEIRTQLGIKGMERKGPQIASEALLQLIQDIKRI
jgi:hypothetical protein